MHLYYAGTDERAEPEDLGVEEAEYYDAVYESMADQATTGDGVIWVRGYKVVAK